MLTLKTPFHHENILGLMNKVKNDSFDPLPERTPPELQELVSELLEKDPDKRPSIFQIAKRNFLKSLIKTIIEQSDDFSNVKAFFNMVFLKSLNSPNPSQSKMTSPISESNSKFVIFHNLYKYI